MVKTYRIRRLLLASVSILVLVTALLATGCGEEEKFNKEKAAILEDMKLVRQIKVPQDIKGDALDLAIRESGKRHKEALQAVDDKLKALGEKYGKADKKFAAEAEDLRKTLKQDHIEWMKAAVAPKIKGDSVMGVGIGCRWEEIEEILGEPIEIKQTAGFKEFKYPGLVFNEIKDYDETDGKDRPALYGPDAYYMTGTGYKTGCGIQIGMTKEQVIEKYRGKFSMMDDHTDPKFILMRYDPTPDHLHAYNQFMQLTDGKLTRLIVARH